MIRFLPDGSKCSLGFSFSTQAPFKVHLCLVAMSLISFQSQIISLSFSFRGEWWLCLIELTLHSRHVCFVIGFMLSSFGYDSTCVMLCASIARSGAQMEVYFWWCDVGLAGPLGVSASLLSVKLLPLKIGYDLCKSCNHAVGSCASETEPTVWISKLIIEM